MEKTEAQAAQTESPPSLSEETKAGSSRGHTSSEPRGFHPLALLVLREVNRWFDDFLPHGCATWMPCSVERKAHTTACVRSSRGLIQSCRNADSLIFLVTKHSFRAFDDELLLRSTVLLSILAVPVLWHELCLSTLRLRFLILRPSLRVCVRLSCHASHL